MKIRLDNKFNAFPNKTILGYVGETNARTITFSGLSVSGANSYSMIIDYGDGENYEVNIVDGVYTVDASVLKRPGLVNCQVLAKALSEDGTTYTIVKKSNIFALNIGKSIDPGAIPTYEQATSAVEKLVQINPNANDVLKFTEQIDQNVDDIAELSGNVEELKGDINTLADKCINVFNHVSLADGYFYHNSSGSKISDTTKRVTTWVPIKKDVTYYYKNIYLYFCNVSYDQSTWTALGDDGSVTSSGGMFTAQNDGYIVLTISNNAVGNAIFTDSKELVVNDIVDDVFITNKLKVSMDNIIGYARNILDEFESRNTGYYYHNSTTIKQTSDFYNYPPIRIYKGETYYYSNVIKYFTNLLYDETTATALSEEPSDPNYGSFTASDNGYIYITCANKKQNAILTTDINYYLSSVNSSKLESVDDIIISVNTYIPKVYYVGAGRQYTRIRDAVYNAKQNKGSIVYIDEGSYDLCEEFSSEISNSMTQYFGIGLSNDVKLIFSPKAYVTALYNGTDTNVLTYFCPFYPLYENGGFEIHNLNIKAKNTRYCIHDELAGSTITHRNVIYKNCNMEYENTINDTYSQCIGGGLGKESTIDIIGCKFHSISSNVAVSYHNNRLGDSKGIITVKDCYFVGNNTVRFTSIGDNPNKTECYVSNNRLGSSPICDETNMTMLAFNNEIAN